MARARTAPTPDRGNEKEQQRLRAFASDFLALAGCTVADRGAEVYAALPEDLSTLFGTAELRLAFQAHPDLDPAVHLVQPGSVILERMVEHLRERVGIALGQIPPAVAPEAGLPPEIEFRCEARLARVDTDPEEYVTFNFRASYVSDEKNEELLPVTVDSEGRPVADPEILARIHSAGPAEGAIETSRRTLGALYAAAEERARLHAEQTATRYEHETLPRLYRELTRLRAFYQAQVGELDPTQEQDAALRDHYERELRLRTDEEIQNHRMTVSLALANFRVVRAPRAQLRVRLRSPHAQRTVVLERDLATGALTIPACEACGEPLRAADLCAGGHLACPECLHGCARCGRTGCAACGMETCARCEQEVCEECRATCPACGNTVCREHTGTCPVCGRHVCDACLRECAVCHAAQCIAHLHECSTCGAAACPDCRETCAACGAVSCAAHTGTCERCGQTFCPSHLAHCAVCGAIRCAAHIETCATCRTPLCESHRATCGGCDAPLCEAHAERCAVCGEAACASCGPACAVSGKRLCPEHSVICEQCGRTVAPDYSGTCGICGSTACSQHLAECRGCGLLMCLEDISRCHLCEDPFCEECLPGAEVCHTCRDPEAGEPVPLAEVLELNGFPWVWETLAKRSDWRRVRRHDRILYYGSGTTHVLVVSAALDGGFQAARRAGVYDVPERWGRF